MSNSEVLESSAGLFQLRFFMLDFSSNLYLEIQYMPCRNQMKMAWVANRERPLIDTYAILNITEDGKLVIINSNGTFVALNSEQPIMSGNARATLLDSGNLVLKVGEQIVWESFDHPTDTILPGMKLGLFDLKMRQPRKQFLTSWLSPQNPAPGAFTLGVDPNNTKQLVIWERKVIYWRSGIWNGYNFSYLPGLDHKFDTFSFLYSSNENESYFTFTVENTSVSPWIEIDSSGKTVLFELSGDNGFTFESNLTCDDTTLSWSKECVLFEPSKCGSGNVFTQTSGSMSSWEYLNNSELGLSDCRKICTTNCSCNAYASAEPDGTGCKFNRGRKLDNQNSQEVIYIRNNTIVGREMATDHFSDVNKLGQGGFGIVYKGKLPDGLEVAVKRLSKRSGQGQEEFKNEIVLISRLQHRNLIRLLGCCFERKGNILIYEYMPNKSLDSFVFNSTKWSLVDWNKRFCIIEGIAQGLLYLHQYSRLRVIHRDLKTSNVCWMDESQANTNRIIGTYGYMSPEYAMDGSFSVKYDVFSFRVMLLEIISGKKNSGFYLFNSFLNLLGYVNGRGAELVDPRLGETCSANDVLHCVQIALLCVQERPADRPTMLEVVSMLNNKMMLLPAPKEPAFLITSRLHDAGLHKNPRSCSLNHLTISDLEAR
uniref:non-specific serine/threonine protein kinase n=1 Tax=Manihot esculenta TaxID=3983 RepID=A0A2C9VN68_MANES